MKIFKRGTGIILAVIFLFCTAAECLAANRYVTYTLNYDGANHTYNAEEVFLKVNGDLLSDLTMPPIILDGYSLVPAREVFEKTGAVVSWNAAREEVYVSKGSNLLVLKINSLTAYYNNKETQMEIPAKLINSKTMIPVRFVAETLGYDVEWDNSTRTIIINSENVEIETVTYEPSPEETTESSEDYKVITIEEDTAGLPSALYDLTDANYYDAQITGIYKGSDGTYVKIEADDEISRVVEGSVSDGRFYLDIYAATSALGRVKGNANIGGIGEIRVGERVENNYNVTRIAMDVSDMDFNVKMTADRTAIYIYYPQPEITDYKLVTDIAEDIFTVKGRDLERPVIRASGTTITMTFENSVLSAAQQTLNRNCLLIDSTDIAQVGSDAVITFELKESASYKTTYSDSEVTITIYETTYKNLNTDEGGDVITLKKTSSFSLSAIKEEDDYLNLKYTITLPGNFSSDYGTGDIYFENSERLNGMSISLVGGNTVFTFDEKLVSAFIITEDSENIYINCVNVHDKYDKIVVIDAGHGGTDVGTSWNGVVEKEVALDIVLKIKALLESDGEIKAYFTRLDDSYPTLSERSDFGNMIDCPFVSVHINSAGTTNTEANGVEVYWQYDNTDENGLSSSALAAAIYNNLVEYLGANGRGVKTSDLHVLRESNNPSVLIEVGFVTNAEEAAKLATDSYRQTAAQAIFDALKAML